MWIVIHFARHAFIRETSANKAKGTALATESYAAADFASAVAAGITARKRMPFDGTQLAPVTKALIAGRRKLEKGWIQGGLRRSDGVCAVGALGSHSEYEACITMMHALGVLQNAFWDIGVRDQSIPEWNDSPNRKCDDVLALYDRAIALSLCA
jgi:hypothetical protein